MDATADSDRTAAPRGAASPCTCGATEAGVATPTGSEGATSREAATEAATGRTAVPGGATATSRPAPRTASLVFDDPLDRPSTDDTDRGWGELPTGADDDFTRFLREKPPHHL
jgi:acetyl-CoA synthetase